MSLSYFEREHFVFRRHRYWQTKSAADGRYRVFYQFGNTGSPKEIGTYDDEPSALRRVQEEYDFELSHAEGRVS